MLESFFKRLLNLKNLPQTRQLNAVLEVGFHGDKYLIELIQELLPQVETVVETGTNVGTTARYIAKNYPHLPIYSCEPDANAFQKATKTLASFPQVILYNQLSPEFLYALYTDKPQLKERLNFYWLDAHSYGYKWPLHDELAFISQQHASGIIAVDDTKIPNRPEFAFMTDNDQICDRDYILNALTKGKTYHLIYPTYTEHTSPHHPLVGVMVIVFGDAVVLPHSTHFYQEKVVL